MSAGAERPTRQCRHQPDRRGRADPGKETDMASTPIVRADGFGLLPSIMILLMLILASLGIVAHAATL
jgi:hypothetical protein